VIVTYTNVAYLNNSSNAVKDLSKPLVVTSCGYYCVDSGRGVKTNRPNGRKDYQLLYIAEGNVHFYFNDKKQIVSKGEMVLFLPYQPQSYFYYPKDASQVYWVHFTGNDVDGILARYGLPRERNAFFSSASPTYRTLFEQMIRELQLCRADYQELLSLLLQQIFLLINRYDEEGGKSSVSALNEIERSVSYFNEHYVEEINIDQYAKSLGISPCWFNRRFKQVMKTTPLQYIISVRLANAKLLLGTKNYNVSETAYAVGFNNPLYFSRLFTKYIGVSPTEYKKRHWEN
jgi:AraC-like DNA-binding protein